MNKYFETIGEYLICLSKTIDELRSNSTYGNHLLQLRVQGDDFFKHFSSVDIVEVLAARSSLKKQEVIFEKFTSDIRKLQKFKKAQYVQYFSLVEMKIGKDASKEEFVKYFNENFMDKVSQMPSAKKMPQFVIERTHYTEPANSRQVALGWMGIEKTDELPDVKKVNLSFRNKAMRKFNGKLIRHMSIKIPQSLWNEIFESDSDIVNIIKKCR